MRPRRTCIVRSRTTTRPPKDLVRPTTSMTMSGGACAARVGSRVGMSCRRQERLHRDRQTYWQLSGADESRLGAEDELRPLLLAENDGRRILRLPRDEAEPGMDRIAATVAGHRDLLAEREARNP